MVVERAKQFALPEEARENVIKEEYLWEKTLKCKNDYHLTFDMQSISFFKGIHYFFYETFCLFPVCLMNIMFSTLFAVRFKF